MAKREVKKVRGVYERDPGSGIWWIQYKQGSVRKREKAGKRSDAIDLYRKRKAELLAGKKLERKNLRHRGVTFGELAKEAEAWAEEHGHKDMRNLKGRMKALIEEYGNREAASIEASELDKWLTAHEAWSPATKNRHKAAFSLVYRHAMANGKEKSNPAKLVRARKESGGRVRYLLDEEETALRKAILERCPHHMAAFLVSIHTGMRLSEQFTLTWSQVDFKQRKIQLTETKNGSNRAVVLNKVAVAALEGLAKREHKPSDRVFLTESGEPIKNPRKWFESCVDDAGIKDYTWHCNRHTFCSKLAMAGVDIRTIAQLAGHKTLAMAMRYSHLSPAHTLSAVERIA
jgi:site-specific recombinase XerD